MVPDGSPPLEPVPPRGVARLALPALLLVFAGLAVGSLLGDSVTFDESAYIASGFTQLDRGDYRLNKEVPPLAPMICMAPLVLFGKLEVDYQSAAWKEAVHYKLGYEILHGPADAEERRDPSGILIAARLPMVALGVALGLIIYFWAKEMWGRREALAALFLYALSPTMLAHTRLVTMDLPAAFGFTATLWSFWRFCRRPGWVRAWILGIALGVALLLKHSMVTLIPILVILLLLWVCDSQAAAGDWRSRLRTGSGALLLAAVVAGHTIWLCYRYQYPCSLDPAAARLNWNSPGTQGLLGSVFAFARQQKLLPEAYLYGVLWQFNRGPHDVFLNGQVSQSGWGYYFAEAFALKTTPSLLLLAAAAIVAAARSPRGLTMNGWFLLLPSLYVFYMTSSRGLNIGQRYLAPIYPALFMAGGLCVRAFGGPAWKSWAVGLLLAGHGVSSLSAYPGYLSYFNVFAGGSSNGWKYLVDSNIDWGQDLRRLKSWMSENGIPRVHLAYFGTGDPKAYGIDVQRIQLLDWLPDEEFQVPPKGEVVAVSVTLLQGLWVRQPAVREYLEKLRTRSTPIGKAGDSIFIYRSED
jgi:hypothetical protein